MGKTFSQPWREMPADNTGNLDFVKSYRPKHPEVQHLRILLHGPVGAGKSSFINSVYSVLQGEIRGRALTDGTLVEGSFTKTYKTYRFSQKSDPDNYYCFSINDIVGLEDCKGIHVDDVILALKGHVKDGYKFNPSSPLKEGDEGYNPSPTLQDQVHVLVSVLAGDNQVILTEEIEKKMREIRNIASELAIPQLAILTKCDIACPAVKGKMSNLFKSKYLKGKADELCVMLGIPLNCIFLVKNYEEEMSTSAEADAPILCALRQIISSGDAFFDVERLSFEPWREMPANNTGNLDFVKSYRPKHHEVQHLRILLHGPAGAGKSSFINSVDSVLQGEIRCRALTDGHESGGSFTKTYKTYRFSRKSDPDNYYCFSINDIVGIEERHGVHVDDVILALKGHVKDGYKFNPSSPLKEGDEGYNPSPTRQDQVHVLVSVLPANDQVVLSEKMKIKMREIRNIASELGIPQLIIITKVDRACPAVEHNMDDLYKSKYLKQKVDELCVMLGIPLNCVFLVKNYEEITSIKDNIDVPILCALRKIISYGENFLNDLDSNM